MVTIVCLRFVLSKSFLNGLSNYILFPTHCWRMVWRHRLIKNTQERYEEAASWWASCLTVTYLADRLFGSASRPQWGSTGDMFALTQEQKSILALRKTLLTFPAVQETTDKIFLVTVKLVLSGTLWPTVYLMPDCQFSAKPLLCPIQKLSIHCSNSIIWQLIVPITFSFLSLVTREDSTLECAFCSFWKLKD